MSGRDHNLLNPVLDQNYQNSFIVHGTSLYAAVDHFEGVEIRFVVIVSSIKEIS